MASPQGPTTQSVKGTLVDGGDQDAVVAVCGTPQPEEQIVAVVVHPHEKTQHVRRQDQGETDKKDEESFSHFCNGIAQTHIFEPQVKKHNHLKQDQHEQPKKTQDGRAEDIGGGALLLHLEARLISKLWGTENPPSYPVESMALVRT